MLVTAVILSFNSQAHIRACLESAAAAFQSLDDECEIYVVDNGSTDSSRVIIEDLQRIHPNLIHPIFNPRNLGTTVSRNLALRKARGRYVLVVDSDVVIPESTLPVLISALEADPSCGLAAPRLVFPDGRPQLSVDRFPSIGRKLARFLFLRRLEQAEITRQDTPMPVDYAISAFWLFRREILSRLGGLDERFFYAPEDVDFCASIWLSGYSVVYIPQAVAIHDARELSRRGVFNRFTLYHLIGLARYFLKHRYFFSPKGLYGRIAKASGGAIPGT